MRLNFISLIFASLILVACSSEQQTEVDQGQGISLVQSFLNVSSPLAPYQVGKEYSVGEQTYRPVENLSFVETGLASFYSDGLIGALTASGEPYDSQQFTAAHKTLPLQTLVRVTRSSTNASVVVRINDRGPFVDGRVIDLSARAAGALDMLNDGLATVTIEVLGAETQIFRQALANGRVLPDVGADGSLVIIPSEPTTPTDNLSPVVEPSGRFFVLVGSYATQRDATAIRDRMAPLGNAFVEIDGSVYRVYLGPLSTSLDAQSMLGRVFAEGATNAKVVER